MACWVSRFVAGRWKWRVLFGEVMKGGVAEIVEQVLLVGEVREPV